MTLGAELHPSMTCVYRRRLDGAGGLPTGALGRGLHLLSGGIDSPVAAWQASSKGTATQVFISIRILILRWLLVKM